MCSSLLLSQLPSPPASPMASRSLLPPPFLCICFLLSLVSLSNAQRPKALVVPVTKDAVTLQYVTRINQRTPLVPVKLVVDLGGRFLWVDCGDGAYASSSYRPARCRSAQCSLADANGCGDCFSSPPRPGCNNGTCGLSPENTVTRTSTGGELAGDVVAVKSTDGSKPGPALSTVSQFLFSCAPSFLLSGLASGVAGMAGFGRTRIALPTQLAASFSFHRKFAVCLSSSTSSDDGVIFFGDGPYVLLPNVDASKSLTYTPLVTNPVSTAGTSAPGEPSYEYFVGVKSIKINEKRVSLNTKLLSIDGDGVGGTKISTVHPYTVLETSIYEAFTDAFFEAAANSNNITRVAPVAPFGVCFDSKNVAGTRVGPAVPTIDLVLQSESVYWRIFGANSMVRVTDDVLCLGFVDGGANPRTSIVIGGYSWRTTFCSSIWPRPGLDSPHHSCSGRPLAPTLISPEIHL